MEKYEKMIEAMKSKQLQEDKALIQRHEQITNRVDELGNLLDEKERTISDLQVREYGDRWRELLANTSYVLCRKPNIS